MTHATRTKRFWRRALVWVFPAMVLVLLTSAVREARLQKQRTQSLIREVEACGGGVDAKTPAWMQTVISRLNFLPARTQVWLSDAEEEYFQTLMVDLEGTSIDDASLVHLTGVTKLGWLFLDETHVSDAGLAHLTGLTNLTQLDLSGTQAGDAGLVHLTGMTNLRWLGLSDTHVGDAGLAHLTGLTNLKWLDLSGTQVSDAGLVHLSGLTNLEWLFLDGTQVSDAGATDLEQSLPGTFILFPRPVAPQR